MADNSEQEKTEQPSARRLQDAKRRGQVPRSKELTTIGGLSCALVLLGIFFPFILNSLFLWAKSLFQVSPEALKTGDWLSLSWQSNLAWLGYLSMLLLALWVAHGVLSLLMGGWVWSQEALGIKWQKLSPLAGFKRMFGHQAWVELLKSMVKILLVCVSAWGLWLWHREAIFHVFFQSFPQNWLASAQILLSSLLVVCVVLLLVVLIDVPYQYWQHHQQLKMTLQEVKDEFKETEGKPEVKGRIRQLQREMAQGRMMSAVPQANVILVNPEHYAVALRYDTQLDLAPVVVAKGVDHTAFRIREVAQHHEIDIVEVPPLARAVYYTTELEEPIPDALFLSVAQVLAYVFQLSRHRQGMGQRPQFDPNQITIPEDYQR